MLEIGSGDLGRIDGIIRSQWEGIRLGSERLER